MSDTDTAYYQDCKTKQQQKPDNMLNEFFKNSYLKL